MHSTYKIIDIILSIIVQVSTNLVDIVNSNDYLLDKKYLFVPIVFYVSIKGIISNLHTPTYDFFYLSGLIVDLYFY